MTTDTRTDGSTTSIAVVDGIATHYRVAGSGPPLLMYSPGGFNATLANWENHGLYHRTRMLARLQERFRCITFDKRESGRSGGRFERVRWADYVRQGVGLLDHLGIERAHLMGACVGCSIAALTAVRHPDRVAGMVLYSPAGGPRYRMKQHSRFRAHLAYAAEHGLAGVASLAATSDAAFSADGRVGPWASVLRSDAEFAARYAELDAERYQDTVAAMGRLLFDRDTVPGAEPEDLMALEIPTLIVPGEDSSHAPSAARYLQECIPANEFWDVPVAHQTEQSAPRRVTDFLASVSL
ncbi:alpha/beta fold hydrolase [Mycolicibacterium goodii]|uniref:Alpha/beta hydrolase n=1 Tax=Mycolicibacterium goodii TaxID=134601 RepID=A0ABS6HIT8_MYCGD|nr:alpha/beta hydrolase [Mycolicibacterium goodii]MBU8814722.1 alpha/beta hydrolase [Mycolicibacterium goodii]MBU8822480.1 alpha/beta hydrolase [Mycolicibacterium goodii]MBU8835247.1 alpha/beta hydrolase [Mycolicibacterium goodii]ULN50102.1 alpha/beta hydrolase [Mycolicibacterium goodii]